MDFVDYTVLSLFLLLMLIVGAYAGRQISDIKTYAVGGRNYAHLLYLQRFQRLISGVAILLVSVKKPLNQVLLIRCVC